MAFRLPQFGHFRQRKRSQKIILALVVTSIYVILYFRLRELVRSTIRPFRDHLSGRNFSFVNFSDRMPFHRSFFKASHNSCLREDSGSILSQLEEGIRFVEFDVHYEPQTNRFLIGHDRPGHGAALRGRGNPTSLNLEAWLSIVKDWTDRHPNHAPITIAIDVKTDFQAARAGLPSADLRTLSHLLLSLFGPKLFMPHHLLQANQEDSEKHAHSDTDNLHGNPAEVRASELSWPVVGMLRGRVIVVLSGDLTTRERAVATQGLAPTIASNSQKQVVAAFVSHHDARAGEETPGLITAWSGTHGAPAPDTARITWSQGRPTGALGHSPHLWVDPQGNSVLMLYGSYEGRCGFNSQAGTQGALCYQAGRLVKMSMSGHNDFDIGVEWGDPRGMKLPEGRGEGLVGTRPVRLRQVTLDPDMTTLHFDTRQNPEAPQGVPISYFTLSENLGAEGTSVVAQLVRYGDGKLELDWGTAPSSSLRSVEPSSSSGSTVRIRADPSAPFTSLVTALDTDSARSDKDTPLRSIPASSELRPTSPLTWERIRVPQVFFTEVQCALDGEELLVRDYSIDTHRPARVGSFHRPWFFACTAHGRGLQIAHKWLHAKGLEEEKIVRLWSYNAFAKGVLPRVNFPATDLVNHPEYHRMCEGWNALA